MSRSVISPFEDYQKARVKFVQTIAELATRPQNIEPLNNAGNLRLLELSEHLNSEFPLCENPFYLPVGSAFKSSFLH